MNKTGTERDTQRDISACPAENWMSRQRDIEGGIYMTLRVIYPPCPDGISGRDIEGLAVEHDGQRYVLIGCRHHAKPNGEVVNLLDWETGCASCGDLLVVSTTTTFKNPNRRCDACKAPGKSVRVERRRQIAACP